MIRNKCVLSSHDRLGGFLVATMGRSPFEPQEDFLYDVIQKFLKQSKTSIVQNGTLVVDTKTTLTGFVTDMRRTVLKPMDADATPSN